MWTPNTQRYSLEQVAHHLLELLLLRQLQHLLEFVQEEHLLRRVRHRPVGEQALDHRGGHLRVLVDELGDAVRQLLVERRQRVHLVERYEHVVEEALVFDLEREREAVDDAAYGTRNTRRASGR